MRKTWRLMTTMPDPHGGIEVCILMAQSRRAVLNKLDREWLCWFVGFVDGEGYFYLSLAKRTRQVSIGLIIVLREDDREIIEEIRQVLGFGQIYQISRETDRKRGGRNSNDQIRWSCRRISEIVDVLIPIFDEIPLRTKKQSDYKIWREAALIIYNKRHLSDSGKLRVMELWQQIKAQRVCGASEVYKMPRPVKHRQLPLFVSKVEEEI